MSWCTNQANSYTISIEACHPDVTGKFTDATYQSYVALAADICKRWGLDPQAGGLIRHYDVTGKVCPKWWVDHPEAWEQFKADVAEVMQPIKSGWQRTDIGWWYMYKDGSYPINKWELINHHWYLFNRDGYMVTGWHRWNGKICDPDDGSGDWYFLDNTKNGLLEGACWHSKGNGIMEVWWIK